MKQLEHKDVVLFDNVDQLEEYVELSGDTGIGDCEIYGEFPQIHSKHWSFCVLDDHKLFEVKQTALTRLISYHEYKRLYEQKLPS